MCVQRIYLYMYIYVQIRLDTYKYIQDTFIYVQDTYNIYTPITLVMYKIILGIFSWIYIYEIFVHIHTYTYIHIHIRANTNKIRTDTVVCPGHTTMPWAGVNATPGYAPGWCKCNTLVYMYM